MEVLPEEFRRDITAVAAPVSKVATVQAKLTVPVGRFKDGNVYMTTPSKMFVIPATLKRAITPQKCYTVTIIWDFKYLPARSETSTVANT